MITTSDKEDIQRSLENYPGLQFYPDAEVPYIQGIWEAKFNGVLFETYEVKIDFIHGYPNKLPLVYEISSKIPRLADRHLNPPGWDACLFVADSRWEVWPLGSSFLKFLEIPIHNFFLWQAYYDEFQKPPPSGERSHYDQGVVEYYYERLSVTKPDQALRLLLATKYITKRTDRCPCGKNISFKDCHYETVKLFRDNAEKLYIQKAINIFLEIVEQQRKIYAQKKEKSLIYTFNISPSEILKK